MLKKYTFAFLYLFLIFILIEFGTKYFFPEFNESNIFYDKDKFHRVSKGKDTYFQYKNNTKFRVSKLHGEIIFNDKNSIWFLGDSITNGYGVSFEDTYYSVLKRKLKKDINIYASSEYNYSFKNTFSDLNKTIKTHLKEGDLVFYQFNFNDILDIAKKNSKFNDEDIPNRRSLISFINSTNKFRYKYLNHSSFFKLMQHHASIFVRDTHGNCKERRIDALGPYTYAYFAKGYEEKSQMLWNIFFKDLILVNEKLKNKNIRFFVLIPPISLEINGHEKVNKLKYDLNCSTKNGYKYIKNELKEHNIEIVDILPVFKEFSSSPLNKDKYLFHTHDTNHPNEKGHELIAQEILMKLEESN